MTSESNLLPLSPDEIQQTKHEIPGITHKEEASKQTYILILKQEDNPSHAKLPIGKESLDNICKNLSNICEDEYDSGISAANLFLKDDEVEDVETEAFILPSAKRSRIYENPPPRPPPISGLDQVNTKGIVKRNLFSTTLSPITPQSESFNTSNILDVESPHVVQVNSHANTPTSNLDNKEHPAVRQIFLVSPNQTTPSVTGTSSAIKVLYAPSPLASSTPVTCGHGFTPSTTSPDSGISLSMSSLSSTSLTLSCSDKSTINLPMIPATTPEMVPSSMTTKQAGPGQPIETKITFSRLQVPPTIETEISDDGEKSLDTSLANIQWLGGLQWGEKVLSRRSPAPTVATRWTSEERGRRKEYNLEEISKVNYECGRTKRPPYSYMVLIQMALQSRDDQKMTLREICRWIEDTFTFYKCTAKKGWKNSIRHNLSYYQCFVRTNEDKKKHGARWTLQFKDEKESSRTELARDVCSLPGMIPVFVKQQQCSRSLTPVAVPPCNAVSAPGAVSSAMVPHTGVLPCQQIMSLQSCIARKRTGPTPILPRPVQTYALVPLQNIPTQQKLQHPLQPSNPILFNMAPTSSQQIPSPYTAIKNPKVPISVNKPVCRRKNVSATIQSSDSSGVNILRQAWLNAELSGDDALGKSDLTCVSGRGRKNTTKTKASGKSGLPKPTLYSHKPKKRTRSRVKKPVKNSQEKGLLADSSDSEPDDQFETGLPTPLKQLFQSPDDKNISKHLTTSTPLRNAVISPEHLPSPIRGLTPLRNSCGFDGSFLDILQEEAVHALKLIGSPQGEAVKIGQSPNTSLTEFGIFQISPDKGNKNFSDFQGLSRIFADFDTNFMADAEGLPIDMTTFNWSGLQPLTSPKDKNKPDKS